MTHQVRCGSVLSTQCTICFISSKGLAGSGKLLWKHPESCCTHNTFRLNLPSLSMWLPWSCIYLLFQKVALKNKNKKTLSILHINAMLWFARSEQTLQVTTIQGWENTTNTCLKTNYMHCNLVLVLKFSACKKDSANYWHLYCGQPGLQAPTFQSQVTLLNSVLPPLRFICLCTIWWFGVLSHLHDLVIWRSRVSVNLFSSPKQSWTQYCDHRGFFLSAQLGDLAFMGSVNRFSTATTAPPSNLLTASVPVSPDTHTNSYKAFPSPYRVWSVRSDPRSLIPGQTPQHTEPQCSQATYLLCHHL